MQDLDEQLTALAHGQEVQALQAEGADVAAALDAHIAALDSDISARATHTALEDRLASIAVRLRRDLHREVSDSLNGLAASVSQQLAGVLPLRAAQAERSAHALSAEPSGLRAAHALVAPPVAAVEAAKAVARVERAAGLRAMHGDEDAAVSVSGSRYGEEVGAGRSDDGSAQSVASSATGGQLSDGAGSVTESESSAAGSVSESADPAAASVSTLQDTYEIESTEGFTSAGAGHSSLNRHEKAQRSLGGLVARSNLASMVDSDLGAGPVQGLPDGVAAGALQTFKVCVVHVFQTRWAVVSCPDFRC